MKQPDSEGPVPKLGPTSRRRFLQVSAAAGSLLTACRGTEGTGEKAVSRLGEPVSRYGERSRFETAVRRPLNVRRLEAASSRSPLASFHGILTPPPLHFERHHAGVPEIDPARHRLMIHGMVERPLMLTMEEILRLPSVSRVYFLECSGNSRSEWGPRTGADVQESYGLAGCSEWTGVPLPLVLKEAGVRPEASWMLAEGADACKMQRSIPIEKALDDALLAYAQNGEALRPEQGYPLRLLLPGWEGNTSVKWLRRIKLWKRPYMTRDETSKYTDLLPDGRARQFSFVMEVKSAITQPSGRQSLPGPGFYEIRGLAWSGRGTIESVEVSTDGGQSWQAAELQEPRLPLAFTRFRLPWRWDGSETTLRSRARDDQGSVQPAVEELIRARGRASNYHNNGIKAWKIQSDGSVTSVPIDV